ncbi:MAG: aspartate kinase [Saprospiraceae bacterium]|jgi:aspartate kinase|nr:aspartate kinase [Saprospiraceae bacterium]
MKKNILVYKFGGASIKDVEGIRNVAGILKQHTGKKIVVVISASGKTTNHLEVVMNTHFNQTDGIEAALAVVKDHHKMLMDGLFSPHDAIYDEVAALYSETSWITAPPRSKDYDFIYDQLVSLGELLSTRIVAAYLNRSELPTQWIDARSIIRTDDTYRESQIDWDVTQENIDASVKPILEQGAFVLTQGFIGSTADGYTTTLGREGSDFTAAILSFCLDAEKMIIWKDVEGVLTGDPRLFKNVQKLPWLSYKEAIEMTYYGASVIHPKTIKPLQNKNIPLYVQSFLQPDIDGTYIGPDVEEHYPPIVILDRNQTLLHIATRDFSFVVEHHMARLFKVFADLRIFINMMRNTAISFTVCVPNIPDRIQRLKEILEDEYSVTVEEDLELLTIRHYEEEVLKSMTKGKIILMEERLRNTVQLVIKDIPLIERI